MLWQQHLPATPHAIDLPTGSRPAKRGLAVAMTLESSRTEVCPQDAQVDGEMVALRRVARATPGHVASWMEARVWQVPRLPLIRLTEGRW